MTSWSTGSSSGAGAGEGPADRRCARAHGAREQDQLDREAWRLFTECLEKCQELFAEYLDLVRGVLVRDAGLDRDLFRIADDLVRRTTIAEYRWES